MVILLRLLVKNNNIFIIISKFVEIIIRENPRKEVHEMDVTLVSNAPYSIPRSVDARESLTGKGVTAQMPETSFVSEKKDGISEKVREQVMMNLEDVQNFLYMLIGSKIRVESGNNSIGSSVNTAA